MKTPSSSTGSSALPPTVSSVSNAPKFFVDHKKGEVAELMNLLKNPSIDKDINKKKDIIKRVIAYMTLGVDVSKLFYEMVKASITDDIVLKKMVFLYIVNYADEIDQGAILAINTFLKDMKNTNPKIRGLALRSLCSLKFKGAYEYFANSLYDSLKDAHPYVRKTAVVALLKVYHLNPKLISEKDIDTLYEMIRDKDPLVVTNTLYVLNEILKKEGGIAISSKMIIHLLNIFKELNEWGQSIVLELVSKYAPKDHTQLLDIMNILEDKLKHSSAAIVLGCTRVFINFTKENEVLYPQVMKRLRDPFITLLSGGEIAGNHELSYVILSHIYIIILKGGRNIFSEIYKKFFVKFEEPLYVKKLKLEILVQIANDMNYQEILNEMEEYVNDVNSIFAKNTIRKIGALGLRVDSALGSVVNLLKGLLARSIDYIVAESLCVIRDLSRKYPAIFEEFLRSIEPSIVSVGTDHKGLAALIWLIGEFGEKIGNAAYLVEYLVENICSDVQSNELVYSLLLASCKMFFKSPGEMHQILGKVFEMILKNYHDVDLRDRAYYFYNLMASDIELAESVICGEPSIIDYFSTDQDEEFLDQIFSQFNTLSIIYRKPEEKFVKTYVDEEGIDMLKKIDEKHEVIFDDNEKLEFSPSQAAKTITTNANLLALDELSTNINSYIPNLTKDSFNKNADLDEEKFQTMWKNITTSINRPMKMIVEEIDSSEFVKYLEENNIFVKAFGEVNNVNTFYLFSCETSNEIIFLVKLSLNFKQQDLLYEIKSQNEAYVPKYEEFFLEVIKPLME